MGPTVLALFKQYKTRTEEINGQRFVLGVGQSTAEEYAKELEKGGWRCLVKPPLR